MFLAAPLLAGAALAAPGQAQTTAPAQASRGTTRTTALSQAAPTHTSATIAPSFSPARPGAKAALTFTIQYTGGELGVPSPVHRSVVRFPAGMTLEVPSLRSCTATRLLAHGPGSCPAQSKIGRGHALAEVTVGAQLVAEAVTVWAFIGPPQNNEPTLELLGEGSTPVPGQVVVTGTVVPARAPYGEELVIPVPPVPTLPSNPDVSMVNLTLTIGASPHHRARNANTVLVPSRCPAGGFPFAAEFTYADGSTGSAFATAPCKAGR
jgi:hypothetical protein